MPLSNCKLQLPQHQLLHVEPTLQAPRRKSPRQSQKLTEPQLTPCRLKAEGGHACLAGEEHKRLTNATEVEDKAGYLLEVLRTTRAEFMLQQASITALEARKECLQTSLSAALEKLAVLKKKLQEEVQARLSAEACLRLARQKLSEVGAYDMVSALISAAASGQSSPACDDTADMPNQSSDVHQTSESVQLRQKFFALRGRCDETEQQIQAARGRASILEEQLLAHARYRSVTQSRLQELKQRSTARRSPSTTAHMSSSLRKHIEAELTALLANALAISSAVAASPMNTTNRPHDAVVAGTVATQMALFNIKCMQGALQGLHLAVERASNACVGGRQEVLSLVRSAKQAASNAERLVAVCAETAMPPNSMEDVYGMLSKSDSNTVQNTLSFCVGAELVRRRQAAEESAAAARRLRLNSTTWLQEASQQTLSLAALRDAANAEIVQVEAELSWLDEAETGAEEELRARELRHALLAGHVSQAQEDGELAAADCARLSVVETTGLAAAATAAEKQSFVAVDEAAALAAGAECGRLRLEVQRARDDLRCQRHLEQEQLQKIELDLKSRYSIAQNNLQVSAQLQESQFREELNWLRNANSELAFTQVKALEAFRLEASQLQATLNSIFQEIEEELCSKGRLAAEGDSRSTITESTKKSLARVEERLSATVQQRCEDVQEAEKTKAQLVREHERTLARLTNSSLNSRSHCSLSEGSASPVQREAKNSRPQRPSHR